VARGALNPQKAEKAVFLFVRARHARAKESGELKYKRVAHTGCAYKVNKTKENKNYNLTKMPQAHRFLLKFAFTK